MTDRINALTVVLDQDIREDDVQALVEAIRLLRHVVDVGLNVADPLSEYVLRVRIASTVAHRLAAVSEEILAGSTQTAGTAPA